MLLLTIYFLLSALIAKWLDKRMRVATICHNVMFVFITIYLLLLSDNPYISNMFINIMGENEYDIFISALVSPMQFNTIEISSFVIIEIVVLLLSLVVLSYTAVSVIRRTYTSLKKTINIWESKKDYNICILYKCNYVTRIFLKLGHLRNWFLP